MYPNHLQCLWLLKKVKKSVTITGAFRDAKTRNIITNTQKAAFIVVITNWSRVRAFIKNDRFTFAYIPVKGYRYELTNIPGYKKYFVSHYFNKDTKKLEYIFEKNLQITRDF